MNNKVEVSFNSKGQAEFHIDATDEQLFTALLGIEAYIAEKLEVPVSEIRLHMDELKSKLKVRPIV